MNPEINKLFGEYSTQTGNDIVAALLTLADVLSTKPPEPVFVEPEDCRSYTVKEAATRLKVSSKKVYQMCLAGELRCFRAGRSIRIPIEEIERFESESYVEPQSPGRTLVPAPGGRP